MPTRFELFDRNAWLDGILDKIESGKKRIETPVPSRSPSPILEDGFLVEGEGHASSNDMLRADSDEDEWEGTVMSDNQSGGQSMSEVDEEGDELEEADEPYGEDQTDDDMIEDLDEADHDANQGHVYDSQQAVASDVLEQALQNADAYLAGTVEAVS